MTNETSSPALIPGILPEGLFPPIICGVNTQEAYQRVLAVTGVDIAAGQRGAQGVAGPPGPPASVGYSLKSINLANGAQNATITLEDDELPAHYIWSLNDPTDSGTPLSPAPAIAYWSETSTANQYRVTLTAPVPSTGWSLTGTKVVNQGT